MSVSGLVCTEESSAAVVGCIVPNLIAYLAHICIHKASRLAGNLLRLQKQAGLLVVLVIYQVFLQKQEDRERSDSDEEPFSNSKGVKLSVQSGLLQYVSVCVCPRACVRMQVCMVISSV